MSTNIITLLIFYAFGLLSYFSLGFELPVVLLLSGILGNLTLLRNENLSKKKENDK